MLIDEGGALILIGQKTVIKLSLSDCLRGRACPKLIAVVEGFGHFC